MFVLDSHCDTPSQIHRLRDMGIWNDHAHVDFPKMKKGGVDGAFFALYVPPCLGPAESTSYALELLSDTMDTLDRYPDMAVLQFSWGWRTVLPYRNRFPCSDSSTDQVSDT